MTTSNLLQHFPISFIQFTYSTIEIEITRFDEVITQTITYEIDI